MAAIAVAPPINGIGAPSPMPASPESSSSSKRKRDESDDASAAKTNGVEKMEIDAAEVNQPPRKDQKQLIRDYLEVLSSHDISPSLFERKFPGAAGAGDEPQSKRLKSDDGASLAPDSIPVAETESVTISEKLLKDQYATLDDVVADIEHVVQSFISSVQSGDTSDAALEDDDIAEKALAFRRKALELYRRETAYPIGFSGNPAQLVGDPLDSKYALSVLGQAPQQAKPLFSNLQLSEAATRKLLTANLPPGVTLTKVVPFAAPKRTQHVPTLGKLFPTAPLPPLQPPRPSKSTTKSSILGFHHPDPVEACSYRAGNTYFSQEISVGHWLDYSNATPTQHSHIKHRQRERAQSLAGHKPSSVELEMSEMETLFRKAFSGFAPSKDDSGAIVSSGQAGRIWWQRTGQRQFQRLVQSEESSEDEPDQSASASGAVTPAFEIDEDAIQEAISNWDAIDPSLEDVTGKKAEEEQTIDDKLMEASDLIETLASYQRNRNLILPIKNRRPTDPNGDVMNNQAAIQNPGEEEMKAYHELKNQLFDLILQLPPYAVSRLNSDKLEDLLISTKIEIRTDIRKGIMEEDPSVRAREQQARQQQQQPQPQAQPHLQAAATGPRQQLHRAPSGSAGTPFANHQQYYASPNRPPIPGSAPPYYQQNAGRPQPVTIHQKAPMPGGLVPQHSPHPQPPQHGQHPQGPPHPGQHRPPPPQQYRPQNGFSPAFAGPPMAKSQPPYGHNNMQFPGTPTQGQAPRMQPQPGGFQHGPPAVASPQQPPQQRYPSGGQGFPGAGYVPHPQQQHPQMQQPPQQQHQQQHAMPHPQQQPHPQQMHPQQIPGHPGQRPAQYNPYANGNNMPPRPAGMQPQQVNSAAQQYAHAQIQQHPGGQAPRYPYAPSPGLPPGQGGPVGGQRPQSMGSASPSLPPNGAPMPGSPATQGLRTGPSGFQTFMGENQQQQLIDNAQAEMRRDAQRRAVEFNAGLAPMGLKQQQAPRAGMMPTPNPGVNGGPQMSPSPRQHMASPSPHPGHPGNAHSPVNGLAPHQYQHMPSPQQQQLQHQQFPQPGIARMPQASPSPIPAAGAQPRPPA